MADNGDDPNKKRWLPLESNPDVSYLRYALAIQLWSRPFSWRIGDEQGEQKPARICAVAILHCCILRQYVKALGMKSDFQFVDVFGMDPELLAMVPQPCCSMLLLFPMNDKVIV